MNGQSNGARQGQDPKTGLFQPGNTMAKDRRKRGLTKEDFRALGPKALKVLGDILDDEEAGDAIRLKAAEIIFDRVLGKPTQAVEATVEAKTSDGLSLAEKLEYIKSLQSEGETPTPRK